MVHHAQRVQIFQHYPGLQECIPEQYREGVLNFYSQCIEAVRYGRRAPLSERIDYPGFADAVKELDAPAAQVDRNQVGGGDMDEDEDEEL